MVPRTSWSVSVTITRSICRQWQKRSDIALVAAVFGASRGLEPGVIAIGFEQQRGVREGCSAVNEWRVHGR